MEPKLQTSFIPKKSLMVAAGRPRAGATAGPFMVVALAVFAVSLGMAIGVYFYQRSLVGQIADLDQRLAAARNAFEPGFIDQAAALDKRIEAAKALLAKHIVVSPVFALLERDTIESVRFDSFDFEAKGDGTFSLNLKGEARSFSAVALQSDAFSQEKLFRSVTISNLDLDTNGNVTFEVNAVLDPSVVSYQTMLGTASSTAPGPAAAQ